MMSIDDLFAKYSNNPYMKQRLHHHLNSLPVLLETEELNHERRQLRSSQLTSDQDAFIESFLNNSSYFFLSSNGMFYSYDGTYYVNISENDLNYHILKSITENGNLSAWKYKTKHMILKTIKERPLFRSIPESNTIQLVLNQFFPSVFDTKEETKYFLTILGDALLKKYSEEDPIIFLVTGKPKKMLTDIDMYINNIANISNLTSSIVTKYHDTYDLNNCRLIQVRNTLPVSFLLENSIELLCVCTYYSERFFNSETYLLSQCDDNLKQKVLYLKGKNKEGIFEDFVKKFFETGGNECVVSWKNIHYLWKQYTMQTFLPTNVIYTSVLKTFFCSKYDYTEDGFLKLTSKFLPDVSKFLTFWDQNILLDDNTSELEIDEIISLFRYSSGVSISEQSVLNILNHYFPQVEIVENKYIMGVMCSYWKKTEDILSALTIYKNKKKTIVSLDTLYAFYIKQKFTVKMHASKRFFKKFIETSFSDSMELEQCLKLTNL